MTTALVADNGSRSADLIVRLLDEAGWSVAVVPVADMPHQLRSRTRPMYGMQAHVEFRADGRRILRRFLAEADRHQPRSWRIEPHQDRSPGELAGQRASKGSGD